MGFSLDFMPPCPPDCLIDSKRLPDDESRGYDTIVDKKHEIVYFFYFFIFFKNT